MSVKYNIIGNNYNQTRKADSFLVERLLYYLNPELSGTYLDIGCGTGNYTRELQKNGASFVGIDPSIKMLTKAREKSNNILWLLGSAEKINLPNKSVDGIIATLTIHHWNNLQLAFNELSRILKKDGKIVIFTSTPEQMMGYWLNQYFPKMLTNSMLQMPSFSRIQNAMTSNNLEVVTTEKYFVKSSLEDYFLYCGKDRPKLYLRGDIRQGISSFSSLANQEEVKKGLSQLEKDIEEKSIAKIIKKYKNDLGDYLFIVGEIKKN